MVRLIRLWLATLILSLAIGKAWAQDQLEDGLLVEYHRYSLKIVQRDPTPLIRIYESGRVHIYHSVFSPLAGIYELQLPETEVDALLDLILVSGLDQVHSVGLATIAENSEIAQRQRGELYYTSDRTVSELSVFVPGGRSGPLIFENLQDVDSRFVGLPSISEFADLERRLLKLSKTREGQRIGDPTPIEALR